ncbi:spectinomycin phosphotransferase [Planomicrobium stackebrandtii]|uniref:Spectinomycin phosphotransferase n=1 Tax=Planomicrobium stackebrandtii TaxID=253160 RepID=A0ABU0GRG4_9BACL|nr:phosphotransferase [Planomicrobium stackebrandtii]MDQ0427539.1 spectinomycin phosphotransferase [Planomicrobium stackebrandtii]
MNAKSIVEKFGFHPKEEPVSIYPFSPVYRITSFSKNFIVKQTQNPILKARRLMEYTNNLRKQGVKVVVPAILATENPMSIGEETYVVYPFIAGEFYSGRDVEIKDAGRMFGKIHSLSSSKNEFELDPYNVFDFNEAEVKDSVKNIIKNAAAWDIEISPKLESRLMQSVSNQGELKNARLPHVATPHDFKANNLIYTPDPYLVDPDNAGWIPRVFDLALVLLLFHNELATAPDQPFSHAQWHIFLAGYKEFIAFTLVEENYWQKAVEHVFLDEVMWLMADVIEDWQNPAQRNLFEHLIELLMDLEAYDIK